jgi:hypothetical protein
MFLERVLFFVDPFGKEHTINPSEYNAKKSTSRGYKKALWLVFDPDRSFS